MGCDLYICDKCKDPITEYDVAFHCEECMGIICNSPECLKGSKYDVNKKNKRKDYDDDKLLCYNPEFRYCSECVDKFKSYKEELDRFNNNLDGKLYDEEELDKLNELLNEKKKKKKIPSV